MQFSCESCKATLHIGDEKVKGKRLVVRCKKCGARIQIADPALGPPPAGAAPLSSAPASAPPPKAETSPGKPKKPGDSDTERTQAMDSGVLEQALRASKADDNTLGEAKPLRSAPPPPPPPEPRDPQVWFAMIGGKQTGPMSRAELTLKAAGKEVTPRTYLWKEGMSGWQRAQEVAEVSSMFGPPPSKPPPISLTIPPPIPSATTGSLQPLRGVDLGGLDVDQLHLGEAPLNLDERRSRSPASPVSMPSAADSLELDDRSSSSSGIDLPLELEALNKPAARTAPKAAPAPKPISSLFPPEREIPRDPSVPAPEADDGDRTHVEPLPLGERVHQEAVANELFNTGSGEATPVAAKDLAAWASSELGKKPPATANLPKAPVQSLPPANKGDAPSLGGAAQPQSSDPFANVPNAPGFSMPDPVDTTGNVIARAGVKKSRAGTYLLIFGSLFAAFGLLMWQLNKDQFQVGPEQQQAEKQSLGGTGESVSGLVKGTTSGSAAAPQAEKQKRVAAAQPSNPAAPAQKPEDAAAAATAAQAAQALAALDSEQNGRGIGSHGPKAEAAQATPETSKADASLSQEDIAKKLGENKGALQSCITEALRKEPNLKVGKIHIATVITPSGTVASTKIDKRNVDDSPLGACLKRAIKRIVFPSFQGDEFEVDIPIVVTAGE